MFGQGCYSSEHASVSTRSASQPAGVFVFGFHEHAAQYPDAVGMGVWQGALAGLQGLHTIRDTFDQGPAGGGISHLRRPQGDG